MANEKEFSIKLSAVLSQDKNLFAELKNNQDNPEDKFILRLINGEQSLADLSAEELEKLAGIISNLSVNENLKATRDEVIGQIKNHQEELAKKTILNDPFLGKTSYDLWVMHKNALSSQDPENQALAKQIHDYAVKYIKESNLSVDNAPIIADFYAIDDNVCIQQMSKEGKSPEAIATAYKQLVKERNKKIHLDEYIAEYDKNNGLKDLKLTAEQYDKNETMWRDIISQNQEDLLAAYMKKTPALATIPTDSKLYKETYETLQAAILNELSLQTPVYELAETQPHKALSPFEEKIIAYTEEYQIILNAQKNAVIADELANKKEILRTFLKNYKDIAGNTLNEDQWQNMMNGLTIKAQNGDDNAKQELNKIYKDYKDFAYKYMDDHVDEYYPHIYNAVNANIAQRNSVLAGRIARKTNMLQTPQRSAKLANSFAENHPLLWGGSKKFLQNSVESYGLLFALGPLGMTVRSICKTAATYRKIHAEYKANKEQYKNFAQYLSKNKTAMRELATQAALTTASVGFTIALAATGTLGFGLAGSTLGIGSATTLAATAGQATLLGLTKMKAMGIITGISSAIGYVSARHKLAPKNKELLAILNKYDNSIKVTEATRLFNYKAWFTKNREENILKTLTNAWSNLRREDEFYAKLQKIVPNMSKEDQQKVLAIAKQIQQIKSESYGAAIGGAVGGALAGGMLESSKVSETNTETSQNIEDSNITQSSNALSNEDASKTEQLITESEKTSNTEQTQEQVLVTEHSLSKDDVQHFSKSGPTPIVEKLQQMGVLSDGDKATLLKENGHTLNSPETLPSRVVAAYLGHAYDETETSIHANLTPEQEKELNDFLHSDEYKSRCDELNHGHSAAHENSVPQQDSTPAKEVNDNNTSGDNKAETQKPKAEAEKQSSEAEKPKADNQAEDANKKEQASETKKTKEIDVNNLKNIKEEKIVIYDKNTETAKAYLIKTTEKTTDEQRVAMAMKLYHDENPEAKKIKLDIYGRDGKMEAEIKEKNIVLKSGTTEKDITRVIKNEEGKVRAKVEQQTFKDGTKVQEVEYKGKTANASTVGSENGIKNDKVLGRTTITKPDGSREVYETYKDGDTGKKVTVGTNNTKGHFHDFAKQAIKEAKSNNR